jgi:hypothetical protein
MESRLDNLELRMSRVEVKLEETKVKKNHHQVFFCPETIPKQMFDRLVEVRKQLVKETNRNALNLIFCGDHLAKMIETKCSSLDDRRTIRGIGNVNIDTFGQRFMDILAPPATPSANPVPAPTPPPVSVSAPLAPPDPSTMTKEQTKDLVVKSKKTKPKKQIFP